MLPLPEEIGDTLPPGDSVLRGGSLNRGGGRLGVIIKIIIS